MLRRLVLLGQAQPDTHDEPMSPAPGDATSQDSSRAGGLANVFKGLTGSRSTKSPPPSLQSTSSVALPPLLDHMAAMSTAAPSALSQKHKEAISQLKTGPTNERIAAADCLRHAISEYPLSPVLEVWDAARDLIEPSNAGPARTAGWELLTECVKHQSSTDLERKDFFDTLTAHTNPEDFHLQLAALVDLTRHGRDLSGFDYDVIPLLQRWLRDVYHVVKVARKQASREAKKSNSKTRAATGEENNLQQLFAYIVEVIKFSSSVADEAALSSLVRALVAICLDTNTEQDLRACINVIDTIVTFGALPSESFRECVLVIGSIFCLVPSLHKSAWHTLSMILKSHNGHATVRVLLDLLRNLPADGSSRGKDTRNIRGVLAVLEKLLTKSTEKGYPSIPFTLLMEGLAATVQSTSSIRVHCAVLMLINSLFDAGDGKLHQIIVEEDWSRPLTIAGECAKKSSVGITGDGDSASADSDSDRPYEAVRVELVRLVQRLDELMTIKSPDFVPRQVVVNFLTSVHWLLSDSAACVVLEFFREFRCCSLSDAQWETNLELVRREFFANKSRSSRVRLLALGSITEAYEMLDLVGEHLQEDVVPRLIKDTLNDVSEETDIAVLEALVAFMADVAAASDVPLFNVITGTLKTVIGYDRLIPPVAQLNSKSTSAAVDDSEPEQTPSSIVTKGFIKLFMRCMDTNGVKGARLFDLLVEIAKNSHCTSDARLAAMKLLFRLRADWTGSVFLTLDIESEGLAASLFRTEASLSRKQAGDAAHQTRLVRPELGGPVRSTRGVSFSHGPQDRNIAVRSLSGAKHNPSPYRQQWSLPDPGALPWKPSTIASPVLVSHTELPPQFLSNSSEPSEDGDIPQAISLDLAAWLEAIISIIEKGGDWEVLSMVLVHLPSQLSNHAIFRGAISQIQNLRRVLCEQVRSNTFQDAPISTGLRRADVAICLFHSLTMILSYHGHFQKDQEDEIVRAFVHGISTERCAKYCIHALSICCHELPLSTSKLLAQMLQKMTQIITQPQVPMHILEFLAGLSRLPNLYANFTEDQYRTVFGISIRYLQYVRDKKQSQRSNDGTPPASSPSEAPTGVSDDLPQYVYSLAHHVIAFWFLALKLPDRANLVGWLTKALIADVDGAHNLEEQALVTIDFLQRATYADANESAADVLFTPERFGEILKRRWLMGNSIVTIEQATSTGWAQITKRQASGTSSYLVRETFKPPPLHQTQHIADTAREGGGDNRVLPSHLMVQLMTSSPQVIEAQRPIPLPEDDAIERAIRVFDRNPTVDGHKVGVIYIGEGQTDEADILANVSGSAEYVQILNGLGTLTRLKGSKTNMQGLDREFDSDGQYTFCWRDRVTEIVFHVITQMPTNLEHDPQSNNKKRHIGNDFVNIVFNDSGLPFRFDQFPSEFNYVNIVITPESRVSFLASREHPPSDQEDSMSFYKVQLLSKPGFPTISSASETKMVSLKALPGYVRLLALNASVFSAVWQNREGSDTVSSWRNRLREIRRLRDKFGPKPPSTPTQFNPGYGANSINPSPPSTSLGGGGHHNSSLAAAAQGADASRPVSSVRDSFGSSLRRSSVATFFTSTSEQTSHRSSVMSTSTTTNDTETVPPNAMDTLAESVDFSKWA